MKTFQLKVITNKPCTKVLNNNTVGVAYCPPHDHVKLAIQRNSKFGISNTNVRTYTHTYIHTCMYTYLQTLGLDDSVIVIHCCNS